MVSKQRVTRHKLNAGVNWGFSDTPAPHSHLHTSPPRERSATASSRLVFASVGV